ncbi:MAG: ABC transporter permease, partial [Flavobacteriaceae bacterium]|nr:ABC transporter permease [Flavobacteriaceae bacterium]
MIKNFFKIAFRNLIKNKGFTIINIMGLALGLGCFLVITMYVTDELSYDRFHEKADRIYRLSSHIKFGGTDMNMATTSDAMGQALMNDYPEVVQYTRFYTSEGGKLIKKGNQFITENKITYADSTLFDVFTLPVIHGEADTALDEPNTAVITKSTAERYFDSAADALGKFIEV